MTKKSGFVRKVCALAFASLMTQVVWAATSTARCISVNVANGTATAGGAIVASENAATLVGDIPYAAWCQIATAVVSGKGRQGSTTGVTAWNGSETDTLSEVVVTWSAGANDMQNIRASGTATSYQILRAYYGRANLTGMSSSSIKVENIPYAQYDAIIYISSDSANAKANQSIYVNDVAYYGGTVDEDHPYGTYEGSSSSWGTPTVAGPLSYGVNAIRITGLTGNSVTAALKSGYSNWGIAAIQIVEAVEEDEDLLYSYHLDGDTTYTGKGSADNVTVGSSVAYIDNGVSGKALKADDNSYVKIYNESGLASNEDGWSISFWVNSQEDATWANHGVLRLGDKHYQIQHAGKNKKVNIYASDTNVAANYEGISLDAFERWYHIAFVSSGDDIKIYLDGTLNTTYSPKEGQHLYGTGFAGLTGFTMGEDPAVSRGGTARIDEVSIFAKSLSEAEVKELATKEDASIAKVGEDGFDTLEAAISAANEGSVKTVTLVATSAEAVAVPEGVIVETSTTAQFTGTVTGAGRIVFDGYWPAAATQTNLKDASKWTGTVELKNIPCTLAGNNFGIVPFQNVCNAQSTIAMNGVTSTAYAGANNTYPQITAKEFEIMEGGLTLNDGTGCSSAGAFSTTDKYQGNLIGSGTITVTAYAASNGSTAQVCFKGDHSAFTGSVVVGSHAQNKRIAFVGADENFPGNNKEFGTIYVSSGSTMPVAQTATWTAPGGIKVDGTLKFADTASSGHTKHWMYGALVGGSGTIDTTDCSPLNKSNEVRIIFKGGDDSFGGTIKLKNNVHVIFTNDSATDTNMIFSDQGYVCVEHGKATLASGANWGEGGTGVLAWYDDATIALAGGTVTGNLFLNASPTLEFTSLATKGATITGALTKNGNGKINVKLPTTATSEEMTLLSFGSTSLTTDAFNVTEGPTGFVLAIENNELKLKSASDITTEVTKTVSDQSSEGWVSLGSGGVYTVNGLGGLKIDTLKLKEGSKLVLDPVRTPLLATKLEVSGATTIKLASVWADHADEYATIDCGKFHLVTYPNTITIDPALITIEGLKDGVKKSLEIVDVADSNYKQLVLKVGNYDENGKVIKLTQFGDSITEGIWRGGYIGTPNYRIPLMHRLEAHGYKPQTTGFRGDNLKNSGVYGSSDANGVPAEPQYRLHNGISAQRVFTGNTGGYDRAGFIEGIEAYLEASGDEQDVITIKIGTNDTIGGETAANIFEGWTTLINRLIKERPTARIVVTSILPLVPEDQMTRGGQYSEMIRKAVQGDGDTPSIFPANTVFYVDCRTACPKGEGNFLSDNVHPNWKGYNHMADQWLGGVMAAYAASTGKTYTPNTNTGVEANVPAEYRNGFVKVASMDLNQIKKDISAWGDSPYTTIDTELAAKEAVKIAYYVERSTTTSAKNQFVWVDMDPWTDAKTAASMGVPADMQVNKIVNNLHIVSNLDEIRMVEPTTDGIKGTLLFTNKKANPGKGIAEGPDTKFGMDWNDTIDGNTNYGVMNVSRIYEGATATTHRYALGQTLFSYNGFNDGRTNVLGIGDFAVHCQQSNGNSAVNPLTLNWVSPGDNFTKMNSDCLDNGIIEIWVKLPVVTIEIPAAPTGAEVEVTVDGEVVDASSGSIEAAPGAEIEVAYFAARDYNMDDVVFTFVAGEESTIDISQVVPVAKIYVAQLGNVKYETLQDAIDDAEDGDTVYLTADTTESIYNEFSDITLHLNEGATLTGKTWFTLFNYQHTLTIEGDGAIKGVASDPNPIIAVYNQAGTVNITGGTIEAKNYVIYETESAKTVVTGGKFNLNPGPWLPGGYTTSKTSDGKYYIVETLSYVAKIGEVEYDTLAEAIEAAQAGQLIELACPTDETIAFDKDFVLVIKNNGFNYGTINGAKAEYKRLEGQYTAVANYVMFSKSMEDLVDYVTTNDSKYTGGHGRFYIYDNWTLTKNVRIPARGGATQSIFTVQDEFVLDLNGFTLDQQPIVDKAGKSSGHGGYPTIVADYGKKVTIKDTSAEQKGILCGWGWPVDVYDNPRSCVVLESGTITTHGGQHPNTEKYPTSHGRVIRMMGGSFIMNGGAITLEHLEEGHQIFGIITAQTGEASKHNIEINGGYIQCATAEQLWDPDGTDQPNCLIGGSKGSTAAVEITGGSFSIVPPKTYFAEGLDAVVDENGHFHVQQVIHEGEKVTIAVSDDGEKLAPAVPEEGSVEIIAPDETKVYVIDIANQEAPAALYTVVTKDAEGEVVSTSNIGVVKVQEAVAVKKTIAVAVPFTGATVENLLNTKLLNEGDELKAYVDGAYAMWSLDATGKWTSAKTVKAGGTETAPNAETTALKRGTAVWVTTAGQVVTLGTFDEETKIATADESVNLLANPTMEVFEPEAELVGDQVIETGVDHVRYTVVEQGGAKTWRCSTTIRKTVDGEVIDSEKIETKTPSIRVGRGYWMMKKSQEIK